MGILWVIEKPPIPLPTVPMIKTCMGYPYLCTSLINIKNAWWFRKAVQLIRYWSAKTSMQWVKGHSRDQGNKGSDALAKQGANKQRPDSLNLEIPKDFNIQGVKLPTLMQATAYKGILERKRPEQWNTSKKNLQLTCIAIKWVTGKTEMNATIWLSTQSKTIRPIIQQFLYKMIHRTHLFGKYWRNINGYKDREIMCDMQQNRIDEPYTDTMQGKECTSNMAPSKEPVAPQKHSMAWNLPRNDPRLQWYPPAPELTPEKWLAIRESNPLRPNQASPNPPVRISVLDMDPKMRTSHTGKTSIRGRDQEVIAPSSQ